MDIEGKISELIEESLAKKGFKLMKTEYVRENDHNFLRIMIDKDEPVDLDDCVVATKIINTILDKEDIINEKYILDVCSHPRGGK